MAQSRDKNNTDPLKAFLALHNALSASQAGPRTQDGDDGDAPVPSVGRLKPWNECVTRNERKDKKLTQRVLVRGQPSFERPKSWLKLPDVRIPPLMKTVVAFRASHLVLHYPVIIKPLTKKNYPDKFEKLLMAEEAECEINFRQYDLDLVEFTPVADGFLALDVPGLADGRPSLLQGDTILCDNRRICQDKIYEGCIHAVERDRVLLKFDLKFHESYNGEQYNVKFRESRGQIRRCHWAIQQVADFPDDILFPTKALKFQEPNLTPYGRQVTPFSVSWINLNLNSRQKGAVVNVIRSECRPTPYIIFGPPGTGKTLTLVECILQIFKFYPRSRILACGVSNTCADFIASKLIDSGLVETNNTVRVVARNRLDKCPVKIKDWCRVADEKIEQWMLHRIIITTVSNVGQILGHKLPEGHFTHTFVDEAAQATEPESLMALIPAAKAGGTTVLVGDPCQLGPVCQSITASKNDLGVSLLSRLCGLELYQRNPLANRDFGHYDPRCITKLVESYRCCAQLIKINSELFYHNELICHPQRDELLIRYNVESNQVNFPIVFHAVKGDDVQEPDNPSWCNHAEAVQCVYHLMWLYRNNLKPEDVGIITPYRKQVDTIYKYLRLYRKPACKVATIEEFQGGERKVIILSMVRSSVPNIRHDQKYGLGFVFNDKRFNVATSRAKSLLIVIGNPELLILDETWKKFIKYCKENNAVMGDKFDIPDAPANLDGIIETGSSDDDDPLLGD